MIDVELLSLIEELYRLPHKTAWAKVKEAWQDYHFHLRNPLQVFGPRPSECYNPQ